MKRGGGEKTRQSSMKASAFDDLILEETSHHFCGSLVVSVTNPVTLWAVCISGVILEAGCPTLHQWRNF